MAESTSLGCLLLSKHVWMVFSAGCRPYLGVDSTHLTGKYNGQLATATAIDGHNWMYLVAYGIFYKETKADWT